MNTSLAAASGAITALLIKLYFSHGNGELAYDLYSALNGVLSGLVAITAGCATLEPWAAVLVGAVAGGVYIAAQKLTVKLRIDDCVDGIPIHLFNGIWDLLSTGLLSAPGPIKEAFGTNEHVGLFYSFGQYEAADASLLWCQVLAIVFIMGFNMAVLTPFFLVLKYMNWLRVDAREEIAGLDACYQHATEENDEEIKNAIVQEIRRRQEASRLIEKAPDV